MVGGWRSEHPIRRTRDERSGNQDAIPRRDLEHGDGRERVAAGAAVVQITILSCVQLSDGSIAVRFRTAAGEGEAVWAGKRVTPIGGMVCTAEIDVDDVIEIGRTAAATEAGELSLSRQGDQVCMTGFVEDIDSDGMAFFRLAPDCLCMVQAHPGHGGPGQWLKLTFDRSLLVLTPVGG